ncbi:unnamed protein product [Paramecium primaurelia]|uniref:Uncharacterized protein n=1 Tax=Paramecium primaurelia TaxID=5886 RepID=A0A8S1JTL3_PARPR|nr:unnamed protein product [Paramecium primaurelia]
MRFVAAQYTTAKLMSQRDQCLIQNQRSTRLKSNLIQNCNR